MDIEQLRKVIEYQKHRFLEESSLVEREILQRTTNLIDSKEIIFITGIKRCGKSSLLKIIAKKLIENKKVKINNIGYINFEDPQLFDATLSDCEKIYEIFLENCDILQKKYLFVDEIQYVTGWEKWLNKLYEFENVKIFVTGSNSSLLSSDISSLLTGRNRKLDLYTFSFREYLSLKNYMPKNFSLPEEISKTRRMFKSYLEFGSFPEVIKQQDIELLKAYYSDIIYRDIIGKHNIGKSRELLELGKYLSSNIGQLASSEKLKKMLGLKSAVTVRNYLQLLEDAYLFYRCYLFDFSVKRQIYNPPKVYIADTALSSAVTFHAHPNSGWMLENIVFLELKRSGYEVYYWKSKNNKEVDFIVRDKNKIIKAIQVCFSLEDLETRSRELTALKEVQFELKPKSFLIITNNEEGKEKIGNNEIKIIPIWEWLINEI